ncbi:alpha/beta fold hydrolase [Actinosynnema sp. NPDC059797]
MGYVTTDDGTRIFYKDWAAGRPVVLSHGWPLNADSWDAQALFLASRGYRVVAHDRRGHGRSDQTWHGNEMDTYADDLAAVLDALDLREATLVGFSTGGGEVARYVGRHGTGRVAQVVLVSAVPPFMLRTDDNPGGVPVEVFDGIRAGSLADRSQLYRDDLDAVDVPALVIHGDDDQVVPFEVGGKASADRIKGATLTVYPGAPHGITDTHGERLGDDLLAFLRSYDSDRATTEENR